MKELWEFRRFILGLAAREFRQRYLGSALGAFWVVMNPLALILIYTVVFGQIMGHRLPGREGGLSYGLFLCAGILPWGLFAETLQRCTSVFIDQGNLLKKMSFPRLALPGVVFLSGVMGFAVTIAVLIVLLLVTGRFPGWVLLEFLPLLVLQQTLAVSLGVALGIMNVFFRDVGHATGILLQYWFWFTPIVYPSNILPEWAQQALLLNPMTGVMHGYQEILSGNGGVPVTELGPVLLMIPLTILWARSTYRRFAADMPDYL